MITEKIARKKSKRVFFRNYQMDYVIEFDLHIDIVLIVYMFCAKIFFKKGWCEKILKSRDAQRGITQSMRGVLVV